MAETYTFIENAIPTITLPLNIDYSQGLENKMDIIECGTGYYPLSSTRRNNFKVDVSERICTHRSYKKVDNRNLSIITLDISFTDGSKQTIVLGANIIKEGMATLYQMLIDETVTHGEFDLPYNLIKVIAEQHSSVIASDNVKLITIYYMSLFSLSPTEALIDNLVYVSEDPDLSVIKLFGRFVNGDKIYIKGKAMLVCDFFDILIDTFKQISFKSVRIRIGHIGEVLERIRPTKGFVPIPTSITDYQLLFEERIKTLIDFLRMPYSHTDNDDFGPHLRPQ